jgi:hypothetical protein
MKKFRFVRGTNWWEFFVLPAIKFEVCCELRYLTFEWLKWYVGFEWEA